jgi:hypothetical protein
MPSSEVTIDLEPTPKSYQLNRRDDGDGEKGFI